MKVRYILLILNVFFSGVFSGVCYAGNYFISQGPSGGYGGMHYNSGATVQTQTKVAEVRIYSGDFIDSIQFIYKSDHGYGGLFKGNKYGGNGGNLKVFKLADDEYIETAGGRYGRFIDSLFLITNKGRSMEWGGNGGGADFYYTVPKGGSIWGFNGKSGDYIDAFGVIIKMSL